MSVGITDVSITFFVTDEDECCIGTFCHEQSTCENSVANYTCTCNDGYTANGTNCDGILVNLISKLFTHILSFHLAQGLPNNNRTSGRVAAVSFIHSEIKIQF